MNVRRLLALPLLAGLLTGCGIRATEVPTDFGPAPSRVHCTHAGADITTQASRGVPVQVFLLCRSSLVAVDRTVRVPENAPDSQRRVLVAQGLLDELRANPTGPEQEAGYTSEVRGSLAVKGPRPGDPEDTLRLSTPPDALGPVALAQIVCTFSDSATSEGDGSVILGGPDDEEVRRYECTEEVRARPGTETPPSSGVKGA
ncbi:hypothetical protein QNN03_12425 [Streptomyces sp. GXMU-J15]|uniref:Lipoprotein n=1 Tax=Streptomyces fuscus TaxID=3048495 RepID=A0ABT7IYR7_9ACTN|nr:MULTISPECIES: hypothetical protein [Streptomyces]MDL2077247.1 hypothetical protein [Streptomyces fuscus]SBT93650.1 hypothetical protein GA0115233_106821 [Streptomyces sp. DI166]